MENYDTFNAFGTLQLRASVMQIQEAEKLRYFQCIQCIASIKVHP